MISTVFVWLWRCRLVRGNNDLDGMQTMGIVNALRTGHMYTDMVIAMSIPLVLRMLFDVAGRFKLDVDWVWRYFEAAPTKMYTRTIGHSTIRSSRGYSTSIDDDTQNQILIKAIHLYLHHMGLLKLDHADMRLTSLKDNLGVRCYSYYDDDENGSRKSLAATLAKYQIVHKPPQKKWHRVGQYRSDGKTTSQAAEEQQDEQETSAIKKRNAPSTVFEYPAAKRRRTDQFSSHSQAVAPGLFEVELMLSENEQNSGGNEEGGSDSQRVDVSIELQSEGEKSIDAFVDTAYEWFLDELRKTEDHSRYLYELCVEGEDGGGNHSYKRYKLSDEKTFESLFFQEKDSLLSLIRHFNNKTGKYGIKGYPHKLGLLLHGPPGTGKTSLIKALANHTGRSIVNVPLARISTNEELMSIFFDKTYHVQDDDSGVPVRMGFKDVIFVMEDVDAASGVVRRRDGKRTPRISQQNQMEISLPPPKSVWTMLLESQDSSCQQLVEVLMDKSERLKKAASESAVLHSVAHHMTMLPGLSVVGSEQAAGPNAVPAVEQLASNSLERVNDILNDQQTVDRFNSFHAAILMSLVKNGAPVDAKLEDLLLGDCTSSSENEEGDVYGKRFQRLFPQAAGLSRHVSYSMYQDNNKVEVAETTKMSSGVVDAEAKGTSEKMTGANGPPPVGSPLPSMEGFGSGGGWKPVKDELNLTGLLNVLDGVVDTPGRILVMTTNHPEMLDPALIRPGRIDKKMVLSYMRPKDVVKMLEHYFRLTELNEVQVERVECALLGDDSMGRPALKMTPAQIEQMAAEHDDIEDMIDALEKKAQPLTKMVAAAPVVSSLPSPLGGGVSVNRGATRTTSSSQLTFDM